MIHYLTTNGIGDAWVGNELRIVRKAGIPVVLHAMRSPQQKLFASDWAAELHRQTRQIYPVPPLPLVGNSLLAPFRFGGRFWSALGNGLFGKRESLRGRIACLSHLFVACHWAAQRRALWSKEPVTHIHSQWAHSAGSIAMYGAWLLGVPFSFTGHAADLFRERVALEDKVRRADFIACISQFHRDFYKTLGARDEQLEIVYCGIDVEHFRPRPDADFDHAGRPVHILSAARLVAKKGLCDLIEACRLLVAQGVDLRCTIAGSGPLEETLRRQVADAGLADRVELTGRAIKQEEIPAFMHSGDIFCLPCVRAPDGDIDGLPQMLMEAMACGLPAVSTRIAGIPDLILDNQTGLLVDPEKPNDLAQALRRLIDDPNLCRRLAAEGRAFVLERFEINTALQPLLDQYRRRLDAARPTTSTTQAAIATSRP